MNAAPFQGRGRRRRGGQTLIFLLVVVVVLTFVVLWNFDLHKILHVKLRSQFAGDAAALAAARWQGIALNTIGTLNVMQAVAITEALARGDGDFSEAGAIADLQARLCYTGPMTGMAAAQQAAKNNGLYANSTFSSDVGMHGGRVISDYPIQYRVHPYTNSPSPPTCWDDYGEMIVALAADGIAAMPDNTRLYNDYANHNHLLLNPSFYDAVATADWCWFFLNAYATLQTYGSWRDWPALPVLQQPRPMNSEYFSLQLAKVATLEDLPGLSSSELDDLVDLLGDFAGRVISQEVVQVETQWYCYDASRWTKWTDFIPQGFPFLGTVKAQYDYLGADAAVRTETRSDRLTPGSGSDTITWSAAAKPFGYLDGPVRPDRYGLVLPAFRDVRLVPVDTATGSSGGSRPGWAAHIYDHLPPYMAQGLDGLEPGCWYCGQLRTWENSIFRQSGLAWLQQYSATCRRPSGGGGGFSMGRGGTRRGH